MIAFEGLVSRLITPPERVCRYMCAKRSGCSVKTGIFTKVMVASIVHTRYYRYRCLIYVRLRANLSQTESEKKKLT